MDTARVMAIETAYQSAADRMPGVTMEQFMDAIAGFESYPITVRGEIVGALLVKGPEIHACVLAHVKKRWMSRHVLSILNGVIDQYGYAQTVATTDEGARFVEALGFERDGEIYRSTKKWALNRF